MFFIKTIKAQEKSNVVQERLNRNLLDELNVIRKSTQNVSETHRGQQDARIRFKRIQMTEIKGTLIG